MRLATRSMLWRYGIAALLPALALTAQSVLYARIGGVPSPFLLAYPCVFFIAWFGGLGPGLLSLFLSGLGAWYLFLPPPHSFAVPQLADSLKLGAFLVTGAMFSALVPLSQRRLRSLNRDFVTLLDHTSDFIYFKDEASRIRFCSQAMATLCGFRDWREMAGKHDFEIFPEETARIYYEEELPVFREGKPLLNRIDPYLDRQGQRRWVSTCKWPVFARDGRTVVGIFGISRDVTDERRAVEDLRRESLRNEMLLASASDGIHVLDSKGNVLQANEVFCQMLGYTHEEALKLNVAQWDARWSEHELRNEVLPRLLDHREVFETTHRRRDGAIIEVEVSAAGVEIGGERVLFAASRDITERKRIDQKLRRFAAELTEANRLKDIFTDVLRHDILNPVTAIKMSTELLLKKESDATKVELLGRVRRSTANLVEMTENAAKLASVTSGQTLELVAANPVEVLKSVLPDLDPQLTEKKTTLTVQSSGVFSARFSPMLKDVFANLISNAIKYSPAGSQIDVRVEDRGESWVFSVKDQGAGVPDEFKRTIFNRFERLGKEGVKGSGLGLTITKQIIDLHGGEIWVEDGAQGGSVFVAKLAKSPPAAPRPRRSAPPAGGVGLRP